MAIRNVTITSKNQITLPSEYVKELQLTQSRVLQAEMRNGKIVLTPQPLLADSMKKFWNKHHAAHALSAAEIKQATRSITARRGR